MIKINMLIDIFRKKLEQISNINKYLKNSQNDLKISPRLVIATISVLWKFQVCAIKFSLNYNKKNEFDFAENRSVVNFPVFFSVFN